MEIEEVGLSKYNIASTNVITDFVLRVVKANAIPQTWAVIIPYQAQSNLILDRFRFISRACGVPMSRLPDLITMDTAQGKEWDDVILDQTIDSGNERKDFGIVAGEAQQNVAHTRARKSMMEVCSSRVTNVGGDKEEVKRT